MTKKPVQRPFPSAAYWALVALQVLILLGLIGQRLHLLATGTPVLLQCEPIDPRSLFSGDYVILRYEISNLRRNGRFADLNIFKEKFEDGDTIYVALEEDGENQHWAARAVSHHLDRLQGRYPVVLRGRVESAYVGEVSRVRYGVENYFVPQHEGKIIERQLRKVAVEVAVGSKGESAIKRLFISGREVGFQ